jgi:hypothetical protein
MLKNAIVTTSKYSNGAALAGVSYGTVRNCFSSGRITGGYAGGLLVANGGLVTTSQSAALVHAEGDGGGLVGENGGSIVASFATGNVTGRFPYYGVELGGLVGANGGTNAIIENSYSTGAVLGKSKPVTIGGFVGYNYNGSISTSYSIGQVAAKRRKQYVGGFSGGDAGTIASSYWDADTSGTDQGSGDGNETGLTGLTTAQFQSGLPSGFDPSIWAEDSSINNGFPYLIANPPAK